MSALPSFSTVVAGTGAFKFRTGLVLEATKGYGVVSIGNASVLPTLTINTNALATVLSGTLTTPGALSLTVDEPYYDVDPAMPVEPPGLGSTVQWTVVNGNQSVAASSVSRIQLPRTGGYLTIARQPHLVERESRDERRRMERAPDRRRAQHRVFLPGGSRQ